MKVRLQNLQRKKKQYIMLFIDFCTIIFALYFAFALRIGEFWPSEYIFQSYWIFLLVPIVTVPLYIKLGLYRAVLQYMGLKVVSATFQATTISCLIIGFLMMFFRESNLPRSVIPIFWFKGILTFMFLRILLSIFLYLKSTFLNIIKFLVFDKL